ncbi:retrovirus-related pol polyprotein from transposon TNT 1-94 [Tanacetum coccineum]|uniref:Retrovirus-related pol polyprotein from transposon TNT 1-94 n=1 Tax=Tanacetum coccineum TaxID=301880 RepID=A0ABQ4ZY82_9ASTR
MNEDTIKKDIKKIETINIELDHKSVEISDLNASLQEKVLEITTLKDDLRKLKGKALVDNVVTKHSIDPEMLKIDVESLTPKLLNKKTAHSAYLSTLGKKLRRIPSTVLADLNFRQYKEIVNDSANTNIPSLIRILKLNVLSNDMCVLDFINNDMCVLDFINNVNARVKSKSVKKSSKRKVWKPTGKVFTNIDTSGDLLKSKTNVPDSKSKVPKSISANKKEPSQSWGSIVFDVPSSSLNEMQVLANLENDHVAKIVGYGDFLDWAKFEKVHLCSACAMGKRKKKPYKPKSEDTNQEKLYLLHMDLCGLMRVASVNGNKYILAIVDDYSQFTWVNCLRSDKGLEFVNQTLREYYEKVGISYETSVARSRQQNGVVERRNHMLIEAAHTMLIYAKDPVDRPTPEVIALIAEVVAPDPAASTGSHS